MYSNKVKTVGSVKDFVNKKESPKESVGTKVIQFIDDHSFAFQTAGLTIGIIAASTIGFPDFTFAATDGFSVIDQKANEFYHKIIKVGKWFIIIKGAVDIIRNVVKGDFDSAKKSGLSNVMIYVILLALPWTFEQVDLLFSDL